MSNAKYILFQLEGVAAPNKLFAAILEWVSWLRLAAKPQDKARGD